MKDTNLETSDLRTFRAFDQAYSTTYVCFYTYGKAMPLHLHMQNVLAFCEISLQG